MNTIAHLCTRSIKPYRLAGLATWKWLNETFPLKQAQQTYSRMKSGQVWATLGFKSMKTAYATIKGIEVMRALRKGQASSFYYGQPQGEVYLVNRVFGL